MIALTKRERVLGIALAAGVGVCFLYAVVIRPTYHRIHTLERIIPEKQSELHALEARSVEYSALLKRFESFRTKAASQDPNFQLLPYLETLLDKHALTKNVVTMAPENLQLQGDYAETVVKIELDGIPLKQLIGFLKEIETSEVCTQIGTLHIRRNPTSDSLLDSTIEIHGSPGGQSPVALNVEGRS